MKYRALSRFSRLCLLLPAACSSGTDSRSPDGRASSSGGESVADPAGQSPNLGSETRVSKVDAGAPRPVPSAEGSEPKVGGTSDKPELASGVEPAPGGGGLPLPPLSVECERLTSDPELNWRDGPLSTDQQIVDCLSASLGRPIGYGENTRGGYDSAGASRLAVITKGEPGSAERQIADAIAGDDPTWIVFDKRDFAEPTDIAMYRLHCGETSVQTALGGSEEECLDHSLWCARRGISAEAACLQEFFNVRLNNSALPIRNPRIGSNKTLDGRMSQATIRFSGFAIGSDSSGMPSITSENVVVTYLRFAGAGHTEDHALDPDMLRSTGASHDIWIHKNDFDLTGDSAFDVKVGAFGITMSFNRIQNVKRAVLHGSSDSREINSQIRTTMHHNAFVTTDDQYLELGNTGRRVPLIRRGSSHLWNNVFVNYRKDVLSVRVGASVLFEDNAFVVSRSLQEQDSVQASLAELRDNLLRDINRGNFLGTGSSLFFAESNCLLDPATESSVDASFGSVAPLGEDYSKRSRQTLAAVRETAGQQLVDYVSATAGKLGAAPFSSPGAPSQAEVLAQPRVACQ